jgi:hypothetical protein
MFAEMVKALASFDSAVLTGRDAAGYPCSTRCHPQPGEVAGVLRVTVPPGVGIEPGPASLLCHAHDEKLWNLRAINVRGVLERDDAGWVLRPASSFIPEMTGSPLAMVRTILGLRRTAAAYLAKRGLARPAIPWDRIRAAKGEAAP